MIKNKRTLMKIGVIVLVLMIYFFVTPIKVMINQMIFYLSSLDIDSLKQYILSYGALAPIISFILMIVQSVAAPLPAFLITFANAALFGWKWGAFLSWSSAMAGAALCFFIAKFLGRDVVEKLTSKYAIDSIDEFFDKYGKYTILVCRLLPFISFDIVSYAAGLTSMEFLPIDDGDSAGLAIVQDNKHNMRFIYTKESEILKIRLINTINGLDTIVADAEVEANLLRLKIVGNCQNLAFYYSIDGENYKELISNVNATTLSTDIAGGFVGCTIGLFAYTKNIKGENYSDFLYFEYRNM